MSKDFNPRELEADLSRSDAVRTVAYVKSRHRDDSNPAKGIPVEARKAFLNGVTAGWVGDFLRA